MRGNGPERSGRRSNLSDHRRRTTQSTTGRTRRKREWVSQGGGSDSTGKSDGSGEDWAAVARVMDARLTELGMLQRDLAARAHVSQAIVRELQHDTRRRRRSARTLEALSVTLGWHPRHLHAVLSGQTPPAPGDPIPMPADAVAGRLAAIEHHLHAIEERLIKIQDRLDDGAETDTR